MAKPCVLCGAAVGKGDRHAKGGCRTAPHSERYRRRLRAKRRRGDDSVPVRGVTVAGTGVPKGE
ncbi:MAG TPA: hypothetical protein VD862_00050 [Candidatus Paceibacterota bacterium]|nr:hypothetical protein [Candidatus Paceibacterota bacterium]